MINMTQAVGSEQNSVKNQGTEENLGGLGLSLSVFLISKIGILFHIY